MILVPAQLEGVATRKDKTLKLTFGTHELGEGEGGKLLSLNNSFCFLAIKPETFTPTEKELMEQIKADMLTNTAKSPSQRLRAVIFLNWQQNNEGYEKFDSYYTHKMEAFIDHLKKKLP